MTRILLTVLLLFSFLPLAQAQMDHLGADFFSARSIAEEVLERWPEDEYIYVGMGRSPVLVMSILEELGNEVLHFPITAGHMWPEDILHHHLDHFLTPQMIQSEKKFLFLDYMVAGSFTKIKPKLESYFELNAHLKGRFDFALMANSLAKFDHSFWLSSQNWINLTKHQYVTYYHEHTELEYRMESSEYQSLAYYSLPFRTPLTVEGYNPNVLEVNPDYLELKFEIQRKMDLPYPPKRWGSRLRETCEKLFSFARNAS